MTSPPDVTDALLQVRDLAVEFRVDADTTVRAVKGVSFDVPANTTVALVGESGSGKSVTALAVMGLLPPENARAAATAVSYRGRDLFRLPDREMRHLRGRELAMIFQEPMTSLNPVFTIGFQIEEILTRHLGLSLRQARQRAVELLAEVGIPEPRTRVHSYPFQLSGGQQQRAMIAIAIACKPRLLIADEPTTALDVTVQKQILELLARLQKQHAMSVLFITHDLAIVRDIADEVIVMRDGYIRESGSVRQIFEAPADPYTRALIACRPQLARRPARLPVIEDFVERTAAAPAEEPERTRGLRGDEPIVLEARHLTKTFYLRDGLFRKRALPAVRNASFTVAKGKTLGVVGESGSGKTTLALMLMRLQEPTDGQVLFEGKDLLAEASARRLDYKRRIQIVFQNPYASLNPRFTAGQILVEPMQIHDIGADDRERRELAYAMFEKVGLPAESFFKYPHEFSGGQRQRIAIARCLTLKPDILICDEAVSALDVSIQAQLLNLLQDLQDDYGMSYVFISHDLAVVKYMADQVIVMNRGEIVESAGSDEIYAAPQHPYTRTLLASMPRSLKSSERRDA
jgi:peptide/nickel transport system ATP-binding protein